jgi:glutamate-ammonia-ligase adenylyltransferase
VPTPADLFLSPDLTETQARAYLETLGFRDPVAADGHLQSMADDLVVREALGRVASDLLPSILESPDPDAAVEGISHYVRARTGRAMFLDYLREDPRALHVLTYVMGGSPTLSEILIRTPEYFHWLVRQIDRSAPDRQDHEEELVSILANIDDPGEALNVVRRWKRREILRIGARDLLRRETVQTAIAQLSDIACVAVDFTLAIVMQQRLNDEGLDQAPGTLAVIATEQLGAGELSYGVDIELLCIYDTPRPEDPAVRRFFEKTGAQLVAALCGESREGILYNARLPGWGDNSLPNACSIDEYVDHYAASRDELARSALSRARPIAGDAELGRRFIASTEHLVYGPARRHSPLDTLPRGAVDRASEEIDWFTKKAQLRHGGQHPSLRYAGTLAALDAMRGVGLIEEAVRRELDHAYVFLRSAEHRRQLGLNEEIDEQIAASRERVREICRAIIDCS